MSVFLGFSDVALWNALLAEPFGENVAHSLRWEGNWEWIVGFVSGHGGDVEVLGEVKVWEWRAIHAQELCNFTDTIRSVVEEEECVVVYIIS